MKTVLTEVGGWTPVIDSIVEQHGYMTALVFGAIWRFCQMRNNECTASHDTLAALIGVDRRTILNHANKLVINGYLSEVKRLGEPSTYRDTGKAAMVIRLTFGSQATPGCERGSQVVQEEGVNAVHRGCEADSQVAQGGVNEVHRGCEAGSQGGVNEIHTNKTLLRDDKDIIAPLAQAGKPAMSDSESGVVDLSVEALGLDGGAGREGNAKDTREEGCPAAQSGAGADANDLTPTTAGDRLLFERLGREARALRRRAPGKFPSLACRDKWRRVEGRLSPAELQNAVARGLERGILSVVGLVDFADKWEGNRPPRARQAAPAAVDFQPAEVWQ